MNETVRVQGTAPGPDQILVIGQMVREVIETEIKRKKEIEMKSAVKIHPIKVLIETAIRPPQTKMQGLKNQVKTLLKVRMLTQQIKMMR